MRLKSIILVPLLLMLTIALSAQTPVQKSKITEILNGKEYIVHTVEQGQTLYSISKAYEVDVRNIYESNPGLEESVAAGKKLYIPLKSNAEGQSKPIKTSTNMRLVAKGETLFSLSREYNVSIDDIKQANYGLPEGLKEGMIIEIPVLGSTAGHSTETPKSQPASSGQISPLNVTPSITVNNDPIQQEKPQRGYFEIQERNRETIYELAIRYRVSIDSITSLNPGLGEQLSKSQIIKIPANPTQKDFITQNIKQRMPLSKLARNYGLTEGEVIKVNPYITKQLQPGLMVKIPLPPLKVGETETNNIVVIQTDPIQEESSAAPTSMELCRQRPGKATYNIALLIPLFFDDFDQKIQFISSTNPETPNPVNLKAFQFIRYYEGFMLAVDSLRKTGLNAEIHIFNVEDNVSQAQKLIQNKQLANMHLIVGPFYNSSFRVVSEFAKEQGIPIVNPLSARADVIRDNPFAIKVIPAENRIYGTVGEYIGYKFRDAKVFVARQSAIRDEEPVARLKSSIGNHLLMGELGVVEININRDSLSPFLREAYTDKPNVVVVYSDNKVVILDFLRKLNLLRNKYDITVIGLPNWIEMEGLDYNHLGNLNTHYITTDYADYQSDAVKNFVRSFRELYAADPEIYGFRGYDTGLFFLSALMQYGLNFRNCLPYHDIPLLYTNYRFRQGDGSGFENQEWKVLRMSNFRLYEVSAPAIRR